MTAAHQSMRRCRIRSNERQTPLRCGPHEGGRRRRDLHVLQEGGRREEDGPDEEGDVVRRGADRGDIGREGARARSRRSRWRTARPSTTPGRTGAHQVEPPGTRPACLRCQRESQSSRRAVGEAEHLPRHEGTEAAAGHPPPPLRDLDVARLLGRHPRRPSTMTSPCREAAACIGAGAMRHGGQGGTRVVDTDATRLNDPRERGRTADAAFDRARHHRRPPAGRVLPPAARAIPTARASRTAVRGAGGPDRGRGRLGAARDLPRAARTSPSSRWTSSPRPPGRPRRCPSSCIST